MDQPQIILDPAGFRSLFRKMSDQKLGQGRYDFRLRTLHNDNSTEGPIIPRRGKVPVGI